MRLREFLGTGVQFAVFGSSHCPGKVLKIPRYPGLSDPENQWGRRFRARTEHDLGLLEAYIGSEYLLPTKARLGLSGKAWGIEQQRTSDDWISSCNPATSQVLDQLERIAKRSYLMVYETGFSLDWFGLATQARIPQLVFTSYWGLPSLVIANESDNPQLKVMDSGLLYTGTKPSDQLRLPHELIAWYGTIVGLKIVGRKTGIRFL